jgi:hypothetical protein
MFSPDTQGEDLWELHQWQDSQTCQYANFQDAADKELQKLGSKIESVLKLQELVKERINERTQPDKIFISTDFYQNLADDLILKVFNLLFKNPTRQPTEKVRLSEKKIKASRRCPLVLHNLDIVGLNPLEKLFLQQMEVSTHTVYCIFCICIPCLVADFLVFVFDCSNIRLEDQE